MISGNTKLLGLLGWPVHHSFSPAMHNAAAADLGLDVVYVALPVRPERLGEAVGGLAALGFLGVNVTVPHKEKVIPLLDRVDPAARAIGAVNTIKVEGVETAEPVLSGYNTDWSGFLADLQSYGVDIGGRDCLILGAGGSARAVAYALASAGGRVHIVARRVEQAQQLAADLRPYTPEGALLAYDWAALAEVVVGKTAVSLIVNTTPIGMLPQVDESPWPEGVVLPKGAFVYDLVYNPVETVLVRQARDGGGEAASGLGMLLNQGIQAFQLWTGTEPDRAVMATALKLPKN